MFLFPANLCIRDKFTSRKHAIMKICGYETLVYEKVVRAKYTFVL